MYIPAGVEYLIFADDLKIYCPITSDTSRQLLQKAIDGVSRWCGANGMLLSTQKCMVVKSSNDSHLYYIQLPSARCSACQGSRVRPTSILACTVLMSQGPVLHLLTLCCSLLLTSFGPLLLETRLSISPCIALLSNRKAHTAHLFGVLTPRNMFNCSNPSALVSGGGSSCDATPPATPTHNY